MTIRGTVNATRISKSKHHELLPRKSDIRHTVRGGATPGVIEAKETDTPVTGQTTTPGSVHNGPRE